MAVGWTDKQTCTGWSCPVDPFKCIAGPTPDGWMTSAESCPDSGAAVDSVISPTTESLSSVFTTPFILTTVQSFKTVCNQVEHIQASMFSRECLILRNFLPKDVRILESKKCLSEPCPRNLGSYWEFCVIWSYTMRNHVRISLPSKVLSIFQTNNENKTLSWRIRESNISWGTLDMKRRSLFERSNKVKTWSNCMWKAQKEGRLEQIQK